MSLTRPVNGQTYNGATLFGEYADAIESSQITVQKDKPNNKGLWIRKSKNLFDGKIEYGIFGNGQPVEASNCVRSINYINVIPNQTYCLSVNNELSRVVTNYYDKNFNWIDANHDVNGYLCTTGIFTVPNNCYYIKFRCYSDDLNKFLNGNIQIQLGDIPTNYEEYMEASLYCNRGNGYELVYDDSIIENIISDQFKLNDRNGSIDYNDFTKNGFYQCNFQNGTNAPHQYITGMLLVFRSYYISQMLIGTIGNEIRVYARFYGGSSWTSWKEL